MMVFIITVSHFTHNCNPQQLYISEGISNYTLSPLFWLLSSSPGIVYNCYLFYFLHKKLLILFQNMSYFLTTFHFFSPLTFAPRNLPQGLCQLPLPLCSHDQLCMYLYSSTYMALLLTYLSFFPVDSSLSSKRICIFFLVSQALIKVRHFILF